MKNIHKSLVSVLICLSIFGACVYLIVSGLNTAYYSAYNEFSNVSEVTVNRDYKGLIYYHAYNTTKCTPSQETICKPDNYNVFINCSTVNVSSICADYVDIRVTTDSRPVVKDLQRLGFEITRWSAITTEGVGYTGEDVDFFTSFRCQGQAILRFLGGIFGIMFLGCFIGTIGKSERKVEGNEVE